MSAYDVPPCEACETLLERFVRGLYTCGLVVLMPVVMLYLWRRGRCQPAYRRGWRTRFFGVLEPERGPAPEKSRHLIWVHAVSVGETHAVAPLLAALRARHPDSRWLVTSTTPTGQAAARALFGDLPQVGFSLLPYDFPWAWRRFLRQVAPDLLCLVETELWPNLLAACASHGVPVALVNARVSPRTARAWRRFASLSRPVIRRLALIAAQTVADAAVFREVANRSAVVVGNMKFDVTVDPALQKLGERWRRPGYSVLLAASTRDGEESLILEAWQRMSAAEPDLVENVRLLIVPRHPQRFDTVANMIRACGFAVQRRSRDWRQEGVAIEPSAAPPIGLGDSMGEMAAYYTSSDVALIGGSWLPYGGQNLIEACACGCPVVFGPHIFNFAQAASDALSAGAAQGAASVDDGMRLALAGMRRPEALADWRGRALSFQRRYRGAAQRTLERLLPLLANR
ncbi:MAG: 3-deoxy-D-manno-octulosonic acid transferase [Burkholderiaceae bacterium]|jgi:3-deoxy-D-manno-octulosonic-acid transferase